MIVRNLDIYQGDTCVFDVSVVERDVGSADLSSGRVVMSAVPVTGRSVSPEIQVLPGKILLVFSAAQTQAFDWPSADFDLRFVSGGEVLTLLRGVIRVTPSVTDVSAYVAGSPGGGVQIRRAELDVVLEKGALPAPVLSGVDPNLPDLMDFYMMYGAAAE